jgi:hypothetical protein
MDFSLEFVTTFNMSMAVCPKYKIANPCDIPKFIALNSLI